MRRKTTELDIKALDHCGTFSGYGSVFSVRDRQSDIVERGAFTKSLEQHRSKGTGPVLLWMHDQSQPIGTITKISEDERGLYVEGQLALKTMKGAEAYELLQMKAVRGMSIGYTVPSGASVYDTAAKAHRLKQVDLHEVSIVSIPANADALIDEVKSALLTKTDLEKFLRNAGLSRTQAKALVAGGYAALNPRHADAELATLYNTATQLLKSL
jgi:uncharacterized protein